MSLREIANQAGVSVTTVSRIVNDIERNKVSAETRERVLDIARRMRYRPNPQAVSLVTRRPPNRLGLVLPYHSHVFESFYITDVIRGAVDGAKACNMDVALFVPDSGAIEDMYKDVVYSRDSVAALLLLGATVNEEAVDCCRGAGLPVVAVNNSVADPYVGAVDCDNLGGARRVTEHLLGLGHTRIAFIGGPEESSNARDRMEGFRQAMGAAGLDVDPALVDNGRFEEGEGREAMKRIVARTRDFTAVFAANDSTALGVYKVLRRQGMRIPGDIAVVGFDDIPLAEYIEPALTTVHQPIYRIGRRAVELLAQSVQNRDSDQTPAPRETFRTRLVVRESCGARTRKSHHEDT